MKIYIMSGRRGIEFDVPIISTDLKALKRQMRNWYYETIEDLDEDCIDMDMSFLEDTNACIAYKSDWLEKLITSQKIEIKSI